MPMNQKETFCLCVSKYVASNQADDAQIMMVITIVSKDNRIRHVKRSKNVVQIFSQKKYATIMVFVSELYARLHFTVRDIC